MISTVSSEWLLTDIIIISSGLEDWMAGDLEAWRVRFWDFIY